MEQPIIPQRNGSVNQTRVNPAFFFVTSAMKRQISAIPLDTPAECVILGYSILSVFDHWITARSNGFM
jgi:hypothetical protein